MDNEQGWRRLAAAARQRREERGWTQLDVATRGGLSIDRIQSIEATRTDRYSSRTLTKLERGLEWKTGSCRAILDGDEPTLLEEVLPARSAEPEGSRPTVEDLAAQVAELRRMNAEQLQRNAEQEKRTEELERRIEELTGSQSPAKPTDDNGTRGSGAQSGRKAV